MLSKDDKRFERSFWAHHRWEGLPLTVLEAMTARRPVDATRVGGTPEAAVAALHPS